MENQDREMGPDAKGEEEIARPSRNKKRLTIMIFKEIGKVKIITISPRLLLGASLFLIFYIVVTLFLTNAYLAYFYPLKSDGIDEIQAERIAKLSKELIRVTKNLERSEQHIALLEDYIKEEKEQSPESVAAGDYTESSSPKLVGIEELKVKRDSSTINVAYRIVNRQSNEEPIGGYIFILANLKDSDQSEVWVYPSSPLKDGLPVNYKRGQRFFIQNFKSISNRYTLSKSTDKPLILEILVFDRDGKLVLKKVVEV
jgi:hypothetical protein